MSLVLFSGAISDESVLRCEYCQKGFEEKTHFESHVQTCPMRPPPLLKVPSSVECKEEDPQVISPKPRARWCQKPIHPDEQPRFPMDEFADYLRLTPKNEAGDLLKEDNKSHDVECMDLDLDDEESSCQMNAPATPTRSAKRLLSQLSRDFSPPAKSPRLKSITEDDGEKVEKKPAVEVGDLDLDPDHWNDLIDSSDSESENTCSSYTVKVRCSANLLSIDYSSPLGQRIKDKYNYKRPKPVDTEDELEGYEKFCRTLRNNNRFMDRLRNRENDGFPITFNRRKRIPDHRSHWIKFTRRDRAEFLMVLKTGLTARARKLKKKLKPCSVKLKRITEEEIKKWRRKPRPSQRWQYQSTLNSIYPLANYPHPVPAHLRNAQMQQRMLYQQQRQLQLHQQRTGLVAPQWAGGSAVPVNLTKNMFTPQLNGMLNGHLNVKRQSSTGENSNDSDLICISSDEEDDADIKVTASKTPNPGGQDAQRKSSQTGIIRFKCHLCAAEINGQLGSTDFIAEHFGKRHDVHNIRLHQSVDVNGQTVVTIVQDIPKGNNLVPTTNSNAYNRSAPPPPQKNTSENKPAMSAGDDEVICLD